MGIQIRLLPPFMFSILLSSHNSPLSLSSLFSHQLFPPVSNVRQLLSGLSNPNLIRGTHTETSERRKVTGRWKSEERMDCRTKKHDWRCRITYLVHAPFTKAWVLGSSYRFDTVSCCMSSSSLTFLQVYKVTPSTNKSVICLRVRKRRLFCRMTSSWIAHWEG